MRVYPDNVQAVNLFYAMRTQWRVGFGGPYGLDYNVLYQRMSRMDLTPERFIELEQEIQACEEGALQQMQEEAEEASRSREQGRTR